MLSDEEFRLNKNRVLREWHRANPHKSKEYKRKYQELHPTAKQKARKAEMRPGESLEEYTSRKKKEYYALNRARRLLYTAKHRAKVLGLPFDLTIDDVRIPELCPVFGKPLEFGKILISPMSPTLDRIVPERGYVKDNVQVISSMANLMKQNANREQLLAFSKWVMDKFGEK